MNWTKWMLPPSLAAAVMLGGCGGGEGESAHDDHDDHGHAHAHADEAPAAPAADDEHEHAGHADHAPHEGDVHAEGDAHDHTDEAGAHEDEVTLSPEAIERWGIRVEPAQKRALTERFVAPARVRFNQERIAHVGAAVSGRVSEIKARVGDSVERGQPLLVVASPEYGEAQSAFLQRRTEAATAEAMIEVARQAYERAERLHGQNQSIALAEVQRREGELRAAEGHARSARAAAVAAENALRVLGMDRAAIEALTRTNEIDQRYVVAAPIDGVVVQREATLGESIGPDRDALMVLANMETLWVVVDVPESRVGLVAVDAPATVRIPGGHADAIAGKVAYIAPQLNPATRTVPVRVEVAADAGVLRPGMFVEVELAESAAAEAVLAVPEAALQTVEGGPAVFVAVEGEPNTFAKRAVEVGETVGGMAPVLGGLEEGERVVTSGSFILKADLGKAGAAHEH